jgi:hypothetical protein
MSKGTRVLLVSGIVAGPLFVFIVLIQATVRQGFDIVRLPLSLLSVGDLGWIQMTNFVVDGVLAVACAVGMRRRLQSPPGGNWGPLLIGVYGAGLIAAGFFPPDAALGFPPGTAQGVPAVQSMHSQLHGYAFDIAFLSLIAACFVSARRFAAQRRFGWVAYCVATGLVTPALIVLGFLNTPIMGVLFFAAGSIAMGWLALVSARAASRTRSERPITTAEIPPN